MWNLSGSRGMPPYHWMEIWKQISPWKEMNDRFEYLNQKENGSNNFLKWPYFNTEHFFYFRTIKKTPSEGNYEKQVLPATRKHGSCVTSWRLDPCTSLLHGFKLLKDSDNITLVITLMLHYPKWATSCTFNKVPLCTFQASLRQEATILDQVKNFPSMQKAQLDSTILKHRIHTLPSFLALKMCSSIKLLNATCLNLHLSNLTKNFKKSLIWGK